VATLAVGCRPVQPASGSAVLIVVDTLRPDHLGDYGYDLPTSPQLDGWMASGRVYERAFATSSWTLPSFASMFTGQLPARHGAGERTGAAENAASRASTRASRPWRRSSASTATPRGRSSATPHSPRRSG
jgi:arylsulfatase A-like enzyme